MKVEKTLGRVLAATGTKAEGCDNEKRWSGTIAQDVAEGSTIRRGCLRLNGKDVDPENEIGKTENGCDSAKLVSDF